MKISLVIVAITILLSFVCLYCEARPKKAQKTLGFLRKIHDRNARPARSVFSSKEEDEEEDDEDEEGWSSKEDAELFLNIFDRNNDGLIDEPELWAFFEALSYDELDIKHMVDSVFQMDHDHDAYLSVDVHIIQTEKQPDIVAWSDSKKSVLLIELTVPWEENREEAHERKKNRYETLRADYMEKGWISHVIPIEKSPLPWRRVYFKGEK